MKKNKKVYIIAEVGPNHNGSYKLARKYIQMLAGSGVDAIKFQISDPQMALSLNSFRAKYEKNAKGYKSKVNLFDEVKKGQLGRDEHAKLSKECKKFKLDYLCSAFDISSLKFLNEKLNIKKFKIPSGEILSLDMLNYINKQNKPVILSTGLANFNEIKKSLNFLKRVRKKISLLHCVSNYPTDPGDVNMSTLIELEKNFKCPVGFSDHTIDGLASISAVSMGATIIEKHVTMDKNMRGPDHKISSTIKEFKQLTKNIRLVEKIIGFKKKNFSKKDKEIFRVARKSIVSVRNIYPGEKIKPNDICFKRPGTGFSPLDRNKVLGKKVKKFIKKNTLILQENLN
jgi:N,N'-diacetyllegionaminate synthase